MCSLPEWEAQPALFEAQVAPPAPPAPPPARRMQSSGRHLIRHRLATDDLAGHGWPAGTLVLVDPDRPAERGDMVLVLDRNRRLVGELDRELGRPAVRHGRGTTWLTGLDQVMGVVTSAEPALVHLPDVASPPSVGQTTAAGE